MSEKSPATLHNIVLDVRSVLGSLPQILLKPVLFKLLIALCFCLTQVLFITWDVNASITRNLSFGPLHLTYDELAFFLKRTHTAIDQANKDDSEKYQNEKVTIGDGSKIIKLSGPFRSSEMKDLPPSAFNLSYSFSSYDNNASVTSVRIDFSDSERTVSIEGNSADQVDVLFSFLKDEMGKYKYIMGGTKIRFASGMLFLTLLFILTLFVISGREYAPKIVTTNFFLAVLIISSIGIVLIFVLPFHKWFPGFLAYDPASSFMVKYSPLFTFLSLLAIPLGFFVSIINKIIKIKIEANNKIEKIETELGKTIKKVEEIKMNPERELPHELDNVEIEVRRLSEEFIKTKNEKMFASRRSEFDLKAREADLNAKWWSVYNDLIKALRIMVDSYNDKLDDEEKIISMIPSMPNDIFSVETSKYRSEITFACGASIIMRFLVERPIETEKLPSVLFDISHKEDARIMTIISINFDPEKRSFRFRRRIGGMDIELNEDEQALNRNYQKNFIDFFKKIIEPQLIS